MAASAGMTAAPMPAEGMAQAYPSGPMPSYTMGGQFVPMGMAGMAAQPVPPMAAAVRTQHACLLPHLNRAVPSQPPGSATLFISDTLASEFIGRQRAVLMQPEVPGAGGVPAELDNFHSLYPLEAIPVDGSTPEPGKVFGFSSVMYKAISDEDGLPYVLRRLDNVRVTDAKAMSQVDAWKAIMHPNVIGIKEAFSKTFADTQKAGTVFVHDFHPLAQSLAQRHLVPRSTHVAEPLLWSYVIQITSALRAIHSAGLACRVIDVSKILVTGRGRVAIGSTGIFDVLLYDEGQTKAMLAHFQQKDLHDLGVVLLMLAGNVRGGMYQDAMPAMMHAVSRNYSEDMFKLIQYLLSPPIAGQFKALHDLMPMIGARFYTEIEAQMGYSALLEGELSKEMHNGRLLRLATKLEFVIDRPEQADDPRWSDTGDRFLLKLLKSYVFHQIQESGEPWLDFSHVVQALNKLDCSDAEKVCLVTPDEQNIMVVSYADLHHCLQKAYTELSNAR